VVVRDVTLSKKKTLRLILRNVLCFLFLYRFFGYSVAEEQVAVHASFTKILLGGF
jgi:hypothetical protein